MRLCSLLLLMQPLLLGTTAEYYKILFGTSDFALITQQNCAQFIETEVGNVDGKCPIGLSNFPNLDTYDHVCTNVKPETVRSHLIRDVHRKNKPRILFVYVNSRTSQINYNIESLSLSGNSTHWAVPEALKVNSRIGYHLNDGESLDDTIFDTSSNLLYLIIKSANREKRRVRTVLISKSYPFFTDFDREFPLHSNANKRYDFVENPYEHTVYYKEKNTSHTSVYKIPISEVLTSLIDGTEGEPVSYIKTLDHDRQLIWAHNGAMVSMGKDPKESTGLSDLYYLRNTTDDSNYWRTCSVHDYDQSKKTTRRLITLFDWDYCSLAPGKDNKECPVYYNTLAAIDNSGSNTIFFVIIALLMMILLVLAVYICYLQRNLEDSFPRDEHKPVPYYPSGQPLDSTFDMSVDRWDQY